MSLFSVCHNFFIFFVYFFVPETLQTVCVCNLRNETTIFVLRRHHFLSFCYRRKKKTSETWWVTRQFLKNERIAWHDTMKNTLKKGPCIMSCHDTTWAYWQNPSCAPPWVESSTKRYFIKSMKLMVIKIVRIFHGTQFQSGNHWFEKWHKFMIFYFTLIVQIKD